MFSERVPIDLHSQDKTQALGALENIFEDVVGNRQEGIVLKAEEASYHDFRTPWIKLKKDYIPGYGDTLDLVVVGAGWDKVRARELRGGSSPFFRPLLIPFQLHQPLLLPCTLVSLPTLTKLKGMYVWTTFLGVKSNYQALD